MKLRLLPLALAAMLSTQAHALDPVTTTAASTIKVWASGASAIRNIVGQIFVNNCASNLDIYFSTASVVGYPNGTTSAFTDADGASHRVYSCTLKADADLDSDLQGKGLGGKNVAFYKRDAGGSAQGVQPVATPSAIASLRINATECKTTGNVGGFDGTNGVTTASYTCIKTDQVVPDLGVSDVEPALFKGINAPAGFPLAGLTSTQLAGLTVTPTFQTIMGVAVSNALYTALQAAQNTTGRPSISRTFAGAAVRGELADPQNGLGWQALGVANPTQQVNVCRRVNGSGTQAAANLLFNQFPCVAPANNPPATNAVSDPARGNALSNTASHWTDGNLYVNEGSGAGNVISCLEKANDFGAYAIGHLSLENPETAKFKFASLDGVEPSRESFKPGTYDYAVESTVQYRTALVTALKAGTADQQAKAGFIEGFALALGRPANMDKLSAATKNGLAALPGSGVFGDPTNFPIDDAFISRVLRVGGTGNNCAPFGIVQ